MTETRNQPPLGPGEGEGANIVTLSRDDIARARIERARRSMRSSAARMRRSAATLRWASLRLEAEQTAMKGHLRRLEKTRIHLDRQRERARRIMREAEEIERLCQALE